MPSAAGSRSRRCCALGARTGRYGPNGRPFPPSSIPWLGARHLAALHRLVRLQRDVGAIDGRRLRPRRAQLAARHGRRHRRRRRSSARPTPASSTTARWPASSRSAPAPTSCTRSARWSSAASPASIFVRGFTFTQERLKIDDVLGVWPLHGLCGLWGGIACGIFGLEALGGMGGVSLARPDRRLGRGLRLRVRRRLDPLHASSSAWSASASPTSSSAAARTSRSTRSARIRRASSEHTQR